MDEFNKVRLLAACQRVVVDFNSDMSVKVDSPIGLAITELDRATDEVLGRYDLPPSPKEVMPS